MKKLFVLVTLLSFASAFALENLASTVGADCGEREGKVVSTTTKEASESTSGNGTTNN